MLPDWPSLTETSPIESEGVELVERGTTKRVMLWAASVVLIVPPVTLTSARRWIALAEVSCHDLGGRCPAVKLARLRLTRALGGRPC